MNGVVKLVEESSTKLFKWFSGNLMKSNADKCHLLVSTNNTVNIRVILITNQFSTVTSKTVTKLVKKFMH